ncbi:MAG: DUF488 domain-containing protein [Bacteroides sp.]|nr:DUF488 domain-containing protein [Bacteroides sp.]
MVEELKSFNVAYVVDIRSKPYSRYNKQFNRDIVPYVFAEQGMTYGYMGNQIGIIPEDPSCYTNGIIDYSKLRKADFFIRGLDRLEDAWNKGYKVALMCSETLPENCHRSRLIGVEMEKRGIELQHITGTGKVKGQRGLYVEIVNKEGSRNLFDSENEE